ncbi:MAG: efflux RND transporter permease subunit, partial [Panacagrimonas sp.]
MYPLRFRLARWVLTHRKATWAFFVVVTLFFMGGLPRVELETIFSDLLPSDDPFVQAFKDHPNFGNPLTVAVMIKRKDGGAAAEGAGYEKTIYNADTIAKVWKFTRDIDLTPGVDHDLILSVTTEKARYTEATPFGIDMRPLMGDIAPKTPEEIALFKERVAKSPNTRVFLISNDDTATLITATFIEHQVDYGVVFDFVQKLAADARDEHHEVYVTGQPILIG